MSDQGEEITGLEPELSGLRGQCDDKNRMYTEVVRCQLVNGHDGRHYCLFPSDFRLPHWRGAKYYWSYSEVDGRTQYAVDPACECGDCETSGVLIAERAAAGEIVP